MAFFPNTFTCTFLPLTLFRILQFNNVTGGPMASWSDSSISMHGPTIRTVDFTCPGRQRAQPNRDDPSWASPPCLKLQSSVAAQVWAVCNYNPPTTTTLHPPPPPSSPEELITNYVRSLVQMVLSDGPAVWTSPPTSTPDLSRPRHPWQHRAWSLTASGRKEMWGTRLGVGSALDDCL